MSDKYNGMGFEKLLLPGGIKLSKGNVISLKH